MDYVNLFCFNLPRTVVMGQFGEKFQRGGKLVRESFG
jgi:hypothetical protein